MQISSGLLPGHVLQRGAHGATATLSGSAEHDGVVVAKVTSKGRALPGWKARAVGKAAKGSFKAKLSGLPTGGPYAVTLAVGTESCVVPEIFVGDLWLMAGQSNMEGVGNMADAARPHALVRNFSMARVWERAQDPLHFLPESPDRVHNQGVARTAAELAQAKRTTLKGVGAGVYFGVEMQRRSGVPQGLIATAHGGTSMEQWDPQKRSQGGDSLYGSMLASLQRVGQPIAGVLWYQGESDANPEAVVKYVANMKALVAAMRADLRQPRLPVVIVQIGRFVSPPGGELEWNRIQELQRLLPVSIPRLAVVPSIDLGLDDLIHISGADYAILAQRLAAQAARLAYNDRQELPGPQPATVRVLHGRPTGPAIEVRFNHVVGSLQSSSRPLGFSMVDHQHRPVEQIYKTILDQDRVILELVAPVREDLRLMYGWGRNPTCTITDSRGSGLPVCGPMWVAGFDPLSPFLTEWQVSGILPGESIAGLTQPDPQTCGPLQLRSWDGGRFVNMHEQWAGNSGHAVFVTTVSCAEDMQLELRIGYDGPIRAWIDQEEVVHDMHGINPALEDAHRLRTAMTAGEHRITVLMALNQGRAWGFFMRFGRAGLSEAVRRSGEPIAVPVHKP